MTGRARRIALACVAAWLVPWAGASTRPDDESSTARYQLTYNWQKHDGFHAPYSGPNSLHSHGEKMYTFSLTAHLGFRAWSGGALYLYPDLDPGVPVSGSLVGQGGFTHGEIPRPAGTDPFDGRDITKASAGARSEMGIARSFQIPRPFVDMTVFENVYVGSAFGGRSSGQAGYDSAAEALEIAGLTQAIAKCENE